MEQEKDLELPSLVSDKFRWRSARLQHDVECAFTISTSNLCVAGVFVMIDRL